MAEVTRGKAQSPSASSATWFHPQKQTLRCFSSDTIKVMPPDTRSFFSPNSSLCFPYTLQQSASLQPSRLSWHLLQDCCWVLHGSTHQTLQSEAILDLPPSLGEDKAILVYAKCSMRMTSVIQLKSSPSHCKSSKNCNKNFEMSFADLRLKCSSTSHFQTVPTVYIWQVFRVQFDGLIRSQFGPIYI